MLMVKIKINSEYGGKSKQKRKKLINLKITIDILFL